MFDASVVVVRNSAGRSGLQRSGTLGRFPSGFSWEVERGKQNGMKSQLRTWSRAWVCLAAAATLLCATPARAVRRGFQTAPNRVIIQARPPVRDVQGPRGAQRPRGVQDHLPQWMARRSNMPLPQLLGALQSEPGFRQATPAQQQQMRDQLIRLYNMRPQQRERILNGNEALERMPPQQRQQFNATMQEYAGLPPDRRAVVGTAFAALRRVPPAERQAAVATYPLIGQFSPQERILLSNLLTWEPYFTAPGR
jgi:hypothetical protein